jgi:DNA-binding response OmpR family regulator
VDLADAVTPGTPAVLIVGFPPERASALAAYFAREGASAECLAQGDEALRRLAGRSTTLALVASSAPGLDARSFCRALREAGGTGPVVVVGREEDLFEHVLCLELGADDYVAADTPERLLWARLKALLRRAGASLDTGVLRVGTLELDRRALLLRGPCEAVRLTLTEFKCIWLLAQRAGEVVSRSDLRLAVGAASPGAGHPRTVDSQICRLRRKLGRAERAANRIRSVRQVGYLFSRA